MARSRNIKPSFFTNETMAENDPLGRLLFLGMTTLADYKGDLEWRPKRIKVQVLPYDNCSIESLAKNLERSRFIRFYSDGEKIFVHIENFAKHQNPHKNEKAQGSDIPSFNEEMSQLVDMTSIAINTEKLGSARDEDGTAPADSLNLIPDSLTPPLPPKPLDGLNLEAWGEYMAHRKQLRAKPLKPASIEKQQQWLVEQGPPDIQQQIVDQTIRNNWQGLFELKTGNSNGAPHQQTRGQSVEDELRDIARKSIKARTAAGSDGGDPGDVQPALPAQVGLRR